MSESSPNLESRKHEVFERQEGMIVEYLTSFHERKDSEDKLVSSAAWRDYVEAAEMLGKSAQVARPMLDPGSGEIIARWLHFGEAHHDDRLRPLEDDYKLEPITVEAQIQEVAPYYTDDSQLRYAAILDQHPIDEDRILAVSLEEVAALLADGGHLSIKDD